MSNRRNGKECLVDSEIAEEIKNGKYTANFSPIKSIGNPRVAQTFKYKQLAWTNCFTIFNF